MGKRFGNAARSARVEQEISLKTVADELGFTAAYISDIERGNRNPPSPEKLRIWAKIIQADPDQFIRLAELDRPSVELSMDGDISRGELALSLARAWTSLTKAEEAQIRSVLARKRGVEP